MSETTEPFTELIVALPADAHAATETILALRVGSEYRVASVPMYAQNLAYGDLVVVRIDDAGRLCVDGVATASGLLTVRIASTGADASGYETLAGRVHARAAAVAQRNERYVAFALDRASFAELEAELDAAYAHGIIEWEVANGA